MVVVDAEAPEGVDAAVEALLNPPVEEPVLPPTAETDADADPVDAEASAEAPVVEDESESGTSSSPDDDNTSEERTD